MSAGDVSDASEVAAQVYQLAKGLADRDSKWFRPAYVAKHADLSKEEAVVELDALAEEGYLEREWDASCADCGRTLKRKPSREEAVEAAVEDGSCFSCGLEIYGPALWVEPVYSPTDRLRPELLRHEAETRPRVSPLANRLETPSSRAANADPTLEP